MVPSIVFIFGAFIGSFLNVCIHRLPRNESIVTPPSRCYSCGTRVQWYDNLPIISYLILGGRCRWCGAGFSVRYLVMELVAGALTVGVMCWVFDRGNHEVLSPWLHWAWGGSPIADLAARACAGAAVLSLAFYLLVSAMIDYEHFIIPDELTKSFQLAAPVLAVMTGANLAYGDAGWLANWLVPPQSLQSAPHAIDVTPGRFLTNLLELGFVVLALLSLSLVAAGRIYRRYSSWEQPWTPEDQRGLSIGVWWFSGCTLVGLLAVTLVVLTKPGAWWSLLALQGAQSLCGSMAGWLSLYLVGLLGTLAFKRNAMGFGDVKFLAPIGAFLGPIGVVYAFFAAALVGTIISVPMRLLKESREIPFGPYLAIGSLMVLYGGPRLHHWLFQPLPH